MEMVEDRMVSLSNHFKYLFEIVFFFCVIVFRLALNDLIFQKTKSRIENRELGIANRDFLCAGSLRASASNPEINKIKID